MEEDDENVLRMHLFVAENKGLTSRCTCGLPRLHMIHPHDFIPGGIARLCRCGWSSAARQHQPYEAKEFDPLYTELYRMVDWLEENIHESTRASAMIRMMHHYIDATKKGITP